jgi:hypothetical protein
VTGGGNLFCVGVLRVSGMGPDQGVDMPERQKGFFEFFERYPDAERREHTHENGKYSTVSIGLFQGHVDGAFIGVYKSDGKLQSEEQLPLDVIESSFGRATVGNAEMLSRLTDLAVEKAGAPISTTSRS